MQTIWYLTPAGALADAVAAHLDRAGVSFVIACPAEPVPENSRTVFLRGGPGCAADIARQIAEAEGKAFVPETPGECLETAVRRGLFPAGTDWQAPMTREEAAVLAVRILTLLKH